MVSSLTRALVAGALLAGAANAGDHFILHRVQSLSLTRIDPIMDPNGIGPHAHLVLGASNFGPDSGSPEKLAQAKCTSTLVQADKSSYWTPQVYYNHGNGSYSAIQQTQTRVYYFLKALNGTTPVVPFPRGFRMIAGGQSGSRPQTYPPRGELSYEQQQAMDPGISAIKWGCSAGAVQGEGTGGSLPGQRPYLPNDAPNGCGVLNAGLFFPSCSDGRLDSDDHYSHMRYPLDGPNGYNCPPSHSIKYPTLFLENFYFMDETQGYRGPNTDNWVLSNGDTLGLTFHGDFMNGWDQDVLSRTLQQCNAPNAPEHDLAKCGPLAESLSPDAADACRSEGLIADEDVGLVAPINALPGCNPIWPVDARTKPSCNSNGAVAAVEPSSRYEVPAFKISLPLASGQSKVVAAPAGTSSTPSSSTPASTSTSAQQSASVAQASAAPTSSTYSYDPYAYGGPGSSTTSAASAAGSAGTQSASVSTTTTSHDPYNYGYNGSAPTTGTTPSPAAAGTSETGSAQSTTTASYNYGAPAPAAAAPPEPATVSQSVPAGEPSASYPPNSSSHPTSAPSSSYPGSSAATADPASAPAPTYPASQPNGSASSVSATPTPVPQQQSANVPAAPGGGKPKTCRRKKVKRATRSQARHHREWQNRIIH